MLRVRVGFAVADAPQRVPTIEFFRGFRGFEGGLERQLAAIPLETFEQFSVTG